MVRPRKESFPAAQRPPEKSPYLKETWKPAWAKEGRQPTFIGSDGPDLAAFGGKQYLWGNMPALDVLNLKQNEGLDETRDYSLLFAASGDIRNLVKSLTGLPSAYTGRCHVTINDREFDIVGRNAILILTALRFDPEVATPIILHIWYSAFIPAAVLDLLQLHILSQVDDVCTKIQSKPLSSLQAKTWTYENRSLRLVLRKEQWFRLKTMFSLPEGLSYSKAQKIRRSVTLAPERKDYVDRALYAQPPPWRVSKMKFREDGIILPFGSSRREFDTPNPTFYQTMEWPMKDDSDPLRGWCVADVLQHSPSAKRDLYGSLFFCVRNLLLEFCRRIRRFAVEIQMFQVDALELPNLLRDRSFDRIEVSNITDRGYLGPELTLSTFGSLLKPKSDNPKAILLGLFLNAIFENGQYDTSVVASLKANGERMAKYLTITRDMFSRDREISNPDLLRFMEASSMFHDYEKPFSHFMEQCRFREISASAGLRMKEENSIVEPWPMRLADGASKEEFDVLYASGQVGCERYVEWERAI
ncbi:hypothetical protein PV04_08738 [Phialophora macrospora]|uniref:DUF4470 domain-containing protein n=1 Tax=Phialophora macrospora TaxID=1851006 RepID=A0A0D2FA09_9EURO|nr:hypothetical protein PV04_08738 [Phialophora macrospora]